MSAGGVTADPPLVPPAPRTEGTAAARTSAAVAAAAERGGEEAGRPVVRLEGIHKVYSSGANRVHALRGVSLEIARGEFVAFMGASGSGKSTLMNILGCLDRPTEGSYWLSGEDVGRLSRDRLADLRNGRLGFVFQGFNLLSRTSALENTEMPLLYGHRHVGGRERRRRALAALERVGLAERAHHKPNELSGGQQQRVAIARALVNEPAFLLADEPTGNLDSRTSAEVMALFQRLNDEGLTILMVTHEHDIAQCARRTLVLRDGLIRSDEPVRDRLDAAAAVAAMPEVA